MEKPTVKLEENVSAKNETGQENSITDPHYSKVEEGADAAEGMKSEEDNTNFMEMYEESLKTHQEGELVAGEIVQISKEFVLVDIGYKSEGQSRPSTSWRRVRPQRPESSAIFLSIL